MGKVFKCSLLIPSFYLFIYFLYLNDNKKPQQWAKQYWKRMNKAEPYSVGLGNMRAN